MRFFWFNYYCSWGSEKTKLSRAGTSEHPGQKSESLHWLIYFLLPILHSTTIYLSSVIIQAILISNSTVEPILFFNCRQNIIWLTENVGRWFKVTLAGNSNLVVLGVGFFEWAMSRLFSFSWSLVYRGKKRSYLEHSSPCSGVQPFTLI